MGLSEKVNLMLVWMMKKLHLQEEVYYIGSSETLPPPLTPEEEQATVGPAGRGWRGCSDCTN